MALLVGTKKSKVFFKGLSYGILFAALLALFLLCIHTIFGGIEAPFGLYFLAGLGWGVSAVALVILVLKVSSEDNQIAYPFFSLACFGAAAFYAYQASSTNEMLLQVPAMLFVVIACVFSRIRFLKHYPLVTFISNLFFMFVCFFYGIYSGSGWRTGAGMLSAGGLFVAFLLFAAVPVVGDVPFFRAKSSFTKLLGKIWMHTVGIFFILVYYAPFIYSLFF